MAACSVYATLSLPALSTFPLGRCIQWSGDGQAIILTRQAVVILTPALGIAVEPSSVIKQSPDRKETGDCKQYVCWYKTMIERQKADEPHQWATECQEWSAVSLGLLDLSFIDVSCSPSSVSEDAGCVIAVLDSNFEVSLYRPLKNHLTGQWSQVGGLLDTLENVADNVAASTNSSNPSLLRILHKQISGISWSTQTDFGVSPTPSVDASLLAVGTCAGAVHLLRYNGDNSVPMTLIETIEPSEKRITHLAWSTWVSKSSLHADALIACGSADGSIVIMQISQSLTPSDSCLQLLQNLRINVSAELFDTPCAATRRSTGALRWITLANAEPVLVFSKPGIIHFWRHASAGAPWSGMKTIPLKTQKLSVASTALAPVSGIAHIPGRDMVVISLSDGSFHVIHNISSNPSLATDESAQKITSEALSTVARRHFKQIEGEEIRKLDVNSTHGMATVDEGSTFLWIYEALRPTEFDYKHEAQHTNMVVMAELFDAEVDLTLMKELEAAIRDAQCVSGDTPIAMLRKYLIHLHDTTAIPAFAQGLSGVLSSPYPEDDSTELNLAPWRGELTANVRQQYRHSLRMHIFGSPGLLSRRLRVNLANFCERHYENQQFQEAFRLVGESTVHTIRSITLRILVRHITAALEVLAPNDIPFARRIAIHAGGTGIADIQAEAAHLSSQLQKLSSRPQQDDASSSLEEPCPACRAAIPFASPTSAVCPNGHHWPRCSMTSFILSTPMVRTCVSCARKVFLPPPRRPGMYPNAGITAAAAWLPAEARTWLVEDLLDAARRCLFCGNGFVTLV